MQGEVEIVVLDSSSHISFSSGSSKMVSDQKDEFVHRMMLLGDSLSFPMCKAFDI